MDDALKLYNQADLLYQTNAPIYNVKSAWSIAEALKTLIVAYETSDNSSIKYRILILMALCNMELHNDDLAYNCAIIAKKHPVYKSSPDEVDNIINKIINNVGQIQFPILMENYVLNECNTLHIRKLYPLKDAAPFSKKILSWTIDTIKSLIIYEYDRSKFLGNHDIVQQNVAFLNSFKYALLFVWQKYMFGKEDEVWDDEEELLPYNYYVSNINHIVPEQLSILLNYKPFLTSDILCGEELTRNLILILTDLNKWLNNGLE